MAETYRLLSGQEPSVIIEDEVIFLDNLKEVEKLSAIKMEYNAIVHCRRGKVLLELGGSQQVTVTAGQILLVPAQKLMQPMMVSTDVEADALFVSDHMLKSVLGHQIDIWNRALYLHETYVIDTQHWSAVINSHASSVFRDQKLTLFHEFMLSTLRIFLLIICEELLHQVSSTPLEGKSASTEREKLLFNKFLDILQNEQQKRHQVNYYAERLCITPKYLSTISRNVSGKSPMRWITDSVMEDCYQLLRNTDLTVKEISARLGFPNSSFFGQYFREQAGVTPVSYRNQQRR